MIPSAASPHAWDQHACRAGLSHHSPDQSWLASCQDTVNDDPDQHGSSALLPHTLQTYPTLLFRLTSPPLFSTITTMVTLLCLIYGEPPDRAFPVCIRMSSTVADLKNKIRLVHPALGGTITLQLTLWRVSIPPNRVVNQLPPRKLHRQELPRRKRIYHIFTKRPVAGHIHIMIEPPKSLVSWRRIPPTCSLSAANLD